MIPSIRKGIISIDDPQFDKIPREDNLLLQLKCIFLALEDSEKQFFNPKGFTHAFKDYEGKPTNVYE